MPGSIPSLLVGALGPGPHAPAPEILAGALVALLLLLVFAGTRRA